MKVRRHFHVPAFEISWFKLLTSCCVDDCCCFQYSWNLNFHDEALNVHKFLSKCVQFLRVVLRLIVCAFRSDTTMSPRKLVGRSSRCLWMMQWTPLTVELNDSRTCIKLYTLFASIYFTLHKWSWKQRYHTTVTIDKKGISYDLTNDYVK